MNNQVNEEKNLGDAVVDRETEQGFTPGPWSLTNDGTYIRPDCLKGTLRRYLPGETPEPEPPIPSWPAICHVEPWPQDRWDCLGEEESRANARLIAAAPVLYESAMLALRYIQTDPVLDDDGIAIVAQLSAALESAKRPISDDTQHSRASEMKRDDREV